MKIILRPDGFEGKVFLEDGRDITKELRVSSIEIKARAGDIVQAILTVYPSEVIVELEDGQLEFVKHPDWDEFKK